MGSPITTHVLNTAEGRPAGGIKTELEFWDAGHWTLLGSGITNSDGRIGDLLPDGHSLQTGTYRLTFQVQNNGFYPCVPIVFEVRSADEHYHVPLLLSPFGYATYRGS